MVRDTRRQHVPPGDHAVPAAQLPQRQPRDDEAAQHQQRHLHDIGQRHRLQPAPDLVQQRERAQRHQRDVLVDPRHLGDRDRAEPDDRGEVHEHVQRQPEQRHQRADARAVPLLQELRHRVDPVAQEDRQEELADDQQRQRRHPFVRRDRQPDRIAGARHADDLFGGDVGCDQRRADRPPGQVLRRQEIIGGVLGAGPRLVARDILREAEDRDAVRDDDGDIDDTQLHGTASPA